MSDEGQRHQRRLERMYRAAPVNHTIPSQVTVGEGVAEVQLEVGPSFWHSGHSLHGSMYFKGLDDAAFFAANSVVEDAFVLTAKFEVELLAVVTCHHLRAVGRLTERSGRKIWAESELFNDKDEVVARGRAFLISNIALDAAAGYNDD